MEPIDFSTSVAKRRRLGDEASASTEESAVDEPTCNECLTRSGTRLPAQAICVTCEHYYCQECVFEHNTAFGDHIVMEKNASDGESMKQVTQMMQMLDNNHLHDDIMLTRLKPMRMLNARHTRDSNTCWLSGCVVLTDDTLAVVDCDNNSIKLINTRDDVIIKYYKFQTKPWDVTEMEAGLIAVTCPEIQTVVILDITGDMFISNRIHVKTDCHGISYRKGMFFISSTAPSVVQVFDKTGQFIQQLDINTETDKSSLDWLLYIAVSPELDDILVSNYFKNKVIRIRLEDTTLNEPDPSPSPPQQASKLACTSLTVSRVESFDHDQLKYPRGMVYDDGGGVFIAGRYNIHRLTSDCRHVQIPLHSKDGIEYAQCVGFSVKQSMLFVGKYRQNSMSNFISVFYVE